jgi:hypothetical protein
LSHTKIPLQGFLPDNEVSHAVFAAAGKGNKDMIFIPVEDARRQVQVFMQKSYKCATHEAIRAQIRDEPGEASIIFRRSMSWQPYEAVICDRAELSNLIYISTIIDFEHRKSSAETPDIAETGITRRTSTTYHEDPASTAGDHARDGRLAPREPALDVRSRIYPGSEKRQ